MADNDTVKNSAGTDVTVANDDIGGVKYPRFKATWGPDGTANDTDVASGKPLPVQIRQSDGTEVTPLATGTVPAPSSAILSVQGPTGDLTSRILSSAASTNATNAKNGAGRVKRIQGENVSASRIYLKIYNKASSPTVGTDTPVKTISLPAQTIFDIALDYYLGTGISYAITGAAADNDTTAIGAGDIICFNLDYQ